MDSMDEVKKLDIAMFPWLAFGHIIPYWELAKLIAQKGHQVSFISTKRNIQRLPQIPTNLLHLINLVNLTLPHEDNLPENAEATMDLPHHKVQYLKKAFDGLQEPLAHFLKTSTPDWIIYDFAAHWLPSIASNLGISRAFFSIFNALTVSFVGPSLPTMINAWTDLRTDPEHLTTPPKWVPFPSNVAFRLYEAKKIFVDNRQENVSGISDNSRFMSAVLGCQVLLVRSCMELEPDWLALLQQLHQKPVVPVGLMPPLAHDSREPEDDTWQTIIKWLDKQEKGSVVYVALGSEVTPSQEDFAELAHGLELSGLPFLWALRNRHDSVGCHLVELPDGFKERVKDRGVVWTSWAPQLRILGHESVGGFLTHCGWSSVIEGLHFRRPLVMLPYLGDQGLNARVLEQKKVGIEILRNEQNGSFSRNSVAESLRLVVVEDKGKIFRDSAKEMNNIFGDEDLHFQYIDKFVGYLMNHTHVSN